MDQLYDISINSEHKFGLGLLGSDMDDLQFSTSCPEIDHEQLLALDDPQSFYLAFPDAGVFGTYDESISRASSAVTPQSECSSKTNFSGRNISPSSDIMSFQDRPNAHDLESIIQDTTHSIISGRHSRATSVPWTQPGIDAAGLSGTLSSTRPFSRRPQSFTCQPPNGSTTPPAPSSYFTSPNITHTQLPAATRSPFLTPNTRSPLTPNHNIYMQTTNMSPNPSSYFALPQSQPPPHFPHTQQPTNSFQLGIQSTQSLIRPHQTTMTSNPSPASMINTFYTQAHLGLTPNSANNSPALPHTTGNSATGYQCFSHGCGGRHFSNWGNLVRHHRERQLRGKTGAKPTCPRCGKGFTRSSARDAHVAGLKCVLGRRRRGQSAPGSVAAAAGDAETADVKVKVTGVDGVAHDKEGDEDDEESMEGGSSNAGRKTRDGTEDAEAVDDDEGVRVERENPRFDLSGLEGDVGVDLDLEFDEDAPTPSEFLDPQHLEF